MDSASVMSKTLENRTKTMLAISSALSDEHPEFLLSLFIVKQSKEQATFAASFKKHKDQSTKILAFKKEDPNKSRLFTEYSI